MFRKDGIVRVEKEKIGCAYFGSMPVLMKAGVHIRIISHLIVKEGEARGWETGSLKGWSIYL